MRIVFMGTPAFAASSLSALLSSRHTVVGVVSQPDRPAGRGKRLLSPPVAVLAKSHDIPLLQPESVKTAAFRAWVSDLAPDIGVVAAFGHILGPKALWVPRLGCINVHASVLPRWRGASPIQSAIAAGDAETGISVMQMDPGMDTGDVWLVERVAIGPTATGATLHDTLAVLGGTSLLAALDGIGAGTLVRMPQRGADATYAKLLSKPDGDVNWSLGATQIGQRLRGYTPWPGARTFLGGDAIKLHPPVDVVALGDAAHAPGVVVAADASGVVVAAGDGQGLRLQRLQAPGKRALAAGDFLRGYGLSPGMRFAVPPDAEEGIGRDIQVSSGA